MKVEPLEIPDALLITPNVYEDDRGYFLEVWQSRKYAQAGIGATFVQDNQSFSKLGTLRGLHYQIHQPQGKLVRVIRGTVFDAVVDIRRSSATFGRWLGVELSAQNKHQLYVPPGFAHGFLVVSDLAEVVYKCTDYYAPEHERTLRWDDPDVAIAWPEIPVKSPILSDKDRQGQALREAEVFP